MAENQTNQDDSESFTTEIEQGLRDDAQGTLRDSVRSSITEQRTQIEATLRRGAPPAEYNRLNTIKQGLDAADTILDRFWNYYNK
ncbi:MAG: hypothetical protein OXJ53_13565 [Gammaproteobacteria bacterium]|nr:hypothetical protein [Gammaproteobacteria bacterium]MDE0273953.1 hypothetical protein [Gammaproteobacteria bacterium]